MNFADIPRTKSAIASQRFEPQACFIAEEDEIPKGWVAVTRLPRDKSFVIRYLCVKKSDSWKMIAGNLLDKALGYVKSENSEYVRATTPAFQPYVDLYRNRGFEPLRRDFRISWRIDEIPRRNDGQVETLEVSDETVDLAGELSVRALSPYWDWRTEEEGGANLVAEGFKADQARGARWLMAKHLEEPVGLVGIIPDFYDEGIAWFRGAMVLPDFRGKGIGSVLMSKIAEYAKRLGQRRMIVYTFSFIDQLAPGALLYLKSGGKIEQEYLQLGLPMAPSNSEK